MTAESIETEFGIWSLTLKGACTAQKMEGLNQDRSRLVLDDVPKLVSPVSGRPGRLDDFRELRGIVRNDEDESDSHIKNAKHLFI